MLANNKIKSLLLLFFLLIPIQVFADENHIITAPQCLLERSQATYQTLAKQKDIFLVSIEEKEIEKLITAKQNHQTVCGGFMDVTVAWKKANAKRTLRHDPHSFLSQYVKQDETPGEEKVYQIKHQTEVEKIFKQINPDLLWEDLKKLTSFHDRYANGENGVKAANWFKHEIEMMIKDHHRDDVEVFLIETTNFIQPSVMVKIGKSAEAGVVVGAHMDTVSGIFSKKPGADDDGSGSTTVLELARLLLASDLKFQKPIYLIWYAAEEEGLYGSQEVVSHFYHSNIPVEAVIHFDMTGYMFKKDPTIWLMRDYVNKDLTAFLEQLITQYVNQPVRYTYCGYACSDHASWTQGGYKAAMPFEASFGKDNPNTHTDRDTMDKLSLPHMVDFLKLAIAFTIELAEPTAS